MHPRAGSYRVFRIFVTRPLLPRFDRVAWVTFDPCDALDRRSVTRAGNYLSQDRSVDSVERRNGKEGRVYTDPDNVVNR